MKKTSQKTSSHPYLDMALPLEERVNDLLSRLTLEEKCGLLTGHMPAIPRLHIKECYLGTEVARGFVSHDETQTCTVFPQPIGFAATFNPDLMYKIGETCGREMQAYNQASGTKSLFTFGPTVDLERDPRWGRIEEGYGEDPYLTGTLSSSYTAGIKGSDDTYYQAIPLLKHFACNNTEKDRASYTANITPQIKHEYYYEAFRRPIVDGNALGVMAAYNEINGVPCLSNPELQSLLKDTWGGKMVISDGSDFSQTTYSHGFTGNHGEALACCLQAGADSMLEGDALVANAAKSALSMGLMTESDIDKALYNVFWCRFKLGEFDDDTKNPYANISLDMVNTKEDRELNAQAAKEQVIMLKNEGILPISGKDAKIAVIGPIADENYRDWYTGISTYNHSVLDGMRETFGAENISYDDGYHHITLQCLEGGKYLQCDSEGVVGAYADTREQASTFKEYDWDFGAINLKSTVNDKFISEDSGMNASESETFAWFMRTWLKPHMVDDTITYKTWSDTHVHIDSTGKLTSSDPSRLTDNKRFVREIASDGCERAAALAKDADYAIVCVGNHPMHNAREGEDRPSTALPKHQMELIDAVRAVNPNTIVVMISSYPFDCSKLVTQVPGILFSSHAGPELGTAISAVVSGGYNPAGRTPFTWYCRDEELPAITEYNIDKAHTTYRYYDGKPVFPFGFGLSYTTFKYEDMTFTPSSTPELAGTISLSVTNTGDTDGHEVVQIYASASENKLHAIKRLVGYQKVWIPAGDTMQVNIAVDTHSLESYIPDLDGFTLLAGDYTFHAGPDSATACVSVDVTLSGYTLPPRDVSKTTMATQFDKFYNAHIEYSKKLQQHFVHTEGWVSHLFFKNVDFTDVTGIEVYAAAPMNPEKITVQDENGNVFTTVELGCSICQDDFTTYRCSFAKPAEGIHMLHLMCTNEVCLHSFKLITGEADGSMESEPHRK